MDISDAAIFRILDVAAALLFAVISFAVCYFACRWLFPTGSRVLIASVTGSTSLVSAFAVYRLMADQTPSQPSN